MKVQDKKGMDGESSTLYKNCLYLNIIKPTGTVCKIISRKKDGLINPWLCKETTHYLLKRRLIQSVK